MALWYQGPLPGYPGLQLSLGLAAYPTSDHHSTCFGWGPLMGMGGALCQDFTKADIKTGRSAPMSYKVWSHVEIIWQRKTDVTFGANLPRVRGAEL